MQHAIAVSKGRVHLVQPRWAWPTGHVVAILPRVPALRRWLAVVHAVVGGVCSLQVGTVVPGGSQWHLIR